MVCIPTGQIYVGLTINSIGDRYRQHIIAARCKNKNHLHQAICEYGAENFEISLIETRRHWHQKSYKAFDRERYWMVKLNSIFPNGLNSTRISKLEIAKHTKKALNAI